MTSFLGLFRRNKNKSTGQTGHDAVENLIRRGNQLEDAGNFEDACQVYREATRLAPEQADTHFHLGNGLSGLGRFAQAVSCYTRAVELQPDFTNALLNLGAMQIRCNSPTAAERSYRSALALRPESGNAWTGLGCALEMKAEVTQAKSAFESALKADPGNEGAASRLAQLLRHTGQAKAALAVLAEALQTNPESELLLRTRAELNTSIGDCEAAIADYRRLQAVAPNRMSDFSNLLWMLNFLPSITTREILAEHNRFGEYIEGRVERMPTRHHAPRDRLRIGYLSPDFRRHSVSCFIEPLLRNHDRSRFEIHGFYLHREWDDVTTRINRNCERWHELSELADDEIVKRIAEHEIDILVDLAGHTAGNRIAVLAAKPAPLQFTWLGYLCTTGLGTIEYRLCDEHTDPSGVAESWQTETPARLPDSQWCYFPQVDLPDPSALPMLRNGFCTFGSFNQESKLNAAVLTAWADLLREIPDSCLRILGVSCDIVEDRIRQAMASAGIAPRRVELVGRLPINAYFDSYRGVDIALDTFPYNGATTTCDALFMGVPVLAIAGNRAIARSGTSILSTCGMSDWIADTSSDLSAVVKRQVSDPTRLAELRSTLRNRILSSPLTNAERFAKSIESIYEDAWNRTLAREPAAQT